jgi:hypothetical protein
MDELEKTQDEPDVEAHRLLEIVAGNRDEEGEQPDAPEA